MAVENGVKVLIIKDDESGLKKGDTKVVSTYDANVLIDLGIAEEFEKAKKTNKEGK